MSMITAKNLNLWYGNFQALKNISIEIPERSITALIGPSGCGKSTFLKTLNRMQDLVPGVKITGDVTYNGQSIFDAEVNNLRKEVGMVFQKPNPFPMSIYDNIAYGPRTHGITNKSQLDDIVEKACTVIRDRNGILPYEIKKDTRNDSILAEKMQSLMIFFSLIKSDIK